MPPGSSLETPPWAALGLGGILDLTLLHRCLCIGTKDEHMVFVPVAHEQTLADDVLEMAQAGWIGTMRFSGAEVLWGCKTWCLDILVLEDITEKTVRQASVGGL